MTLRLFPTVPDWSSAGAPLVESLTEGAFVLRGFARAEEQTLWRDVNRVITESALRGMSTPGGLPMSVRSTSCGDVGWVSDQKGYRYAEIDPVTRFRWPTMPESFLRLALTAAAEVGFAQFVPDSCLINRYDPGARMSLHQDKDECDFAAPIVSVSLGIDAVFLFGGMRRSDKPIRARLYHGDVVVWGGPARLRYHGVSPVAADSHPLVGTHRINLTLRKAR